ncbi:MAG: Cof-type HAD-IIB family hydrolase [Spirochaetaceae bacterium]|jgi:Cof subfamily protein (haloacid dehalogenase superfamily)|nr:Cof-type HAD-IIB family hydrolase [Spirochaetaceae bacterium]
MNFSAVALDLDGTLLTSQKTITPKTLEILNERFSAYKTPVIIASGRSLRDVCQIPEIQQLKADFFICNNGCQVFDAAFNEIYAAYLNGADGLIAALIKKNYLFKLFTADQDYYHLPADYEQKLLDIAKLTAKDSVEDEAAIYKKILLNQSTPFSGGARDLSKLLKISIFTDGGGLNSLDYNGLDEFSVVLTYLTNIEITAKNTSKWTALEAIFNRLNIDKKTALAFGDELNDLEMLKNVGYGVAMANANPALKEQIKQRALSNDEDGVYHALCEFLSKEG